MLVVMAVVVGVRVILTCEKEDLSTRIQHLEILHGNIHLIQSELPEKVRIMKEEPVTG